jgi:hypothetical protein
MVRAKETHAMDLGLDITKLTGRGRKALPLDVSVVRELREEDLQLLAVPGETKPMELKRLSDRHHGLARALASGLSEGEAAVMFGYDLSRVSILKGSPAFQELLSLYRDVKDQEFADMTARLAGLAKDAVLVLQDRLEEAPEEISTGQLLQIVQVGADRTGHGPSSKQEVSVTHNLAQRLDAARQRARAAMIEATALDITPEDSQ